MRRYFNTEGQCEADIHYMVNINERLDQIKELLVDRGKYFVINRGRQYGKTTMLRALADYLKEEYIVISLDFQEMSDANFASEHMFNSSFIEQIERAAGDRNSLMEGLDEKALEKLASMKEDEKATMDKMLFCLSRLCADSKKPVVLMIDEVDNASNNQIFITFLAMLRKYYLQRSNRATFHSVILAGVYNIKELCRNNL